MWAQNKLLKIKIESKINLTVQKFKVCFINNAHQSSWSFLFKNVLIFSILECCEKEIYRG
uniref:Uncharacterized protein n=1 Tax=Rhizophagus irregularis (strain DAOM 181602 / DAOM 197198 / MUCL 43194) TaxID=747089 RepID=U9UFV5_RHIID